MAADPQHIVDQIRAFVAAADQTLTPNLADLSADYATHCTEANARLRRCVDHLRRGLRAEAIHLAEESPPLLELISVLDFAEAPQWANVCAMYELQRPVPLLIELAQELNEAYAAVEPARPLLDLHRRLALEHAPLAERIAVMRELAKLDPASAFWDEDFRLFESTRLKQIRNELPIAAKNKDRKSLDALMAEISAEGWRVEVPADLKTAVVRAHAAARQDHAVTQIQDALPQLDAAYGAMDLPTVTGLIEKIRRLATETRLTLPPELTEKIDPPEQWVRRQQAKAARQAEIDDAIAELTQAVADDHPVETLRQLESEVARAGGVTPDELAAQVAAAETRDAATKSKRKKQWVGVAAALLVALTAGGAIATRAVMHDQVGRRAYSTLADHHQKRDLAAAQADLKRFADETPYVLDRTDVAELAARVRSDAKGDKDRRQQFATAVSVADKAIETASATGAITDAVWNGALNESRAAAKLARSNDERAQADGLLARIDKFRANARADLDGNYRRRIDGFETRLTAYRAAADAGTLAAGDTDFRETLEQAGDLTANISDDRLADTRRRAERVRDGLQAVGVRLDLRQRETEALVRLKAATASADQWKSALQQYVDNCGGTDRARRFADTLDKADAWAAVEKTSRVIDDWTDLLAPAAIADRAKTVATALEAGDTPWSAALTDYQAYLAALEKAHAADGPWKDNFTEELNDKIYGDLNYIHVKSSGKRYYVPVKAKLEPALLNGVRRGTNVPHVKNPNALPGNTNNAKDRFIVSLSGDDFDGKLRPSPQSQLRGELSSLVKKVADGDALAGFAVTDRIVEATEVDPIVQVRLLQHAVGAIKESTVGSASLDEYAQAIDAFTPDDFEWMNPDNAEADKARDDAKKLIDDRAELLKRAREDIAKKCRQMQLALGRHVTGRGVLMKDASQWTVSTTSDTSGGRSVVVPAGKSWQTVGAIRDGQFTVARRGVVDAMDGLMVFFVSPASDESAARAEK